MGECWTVTCQSYGCVRVGYMKSEAHGMYLCAPHAVTGPTPTPSRGDETTPGVGRGGGSDARGSDLTGLQTEGEVQ